MPNILKYKMFTIAIHGGAGTILPHELTPERERAYTEALREAIAAGETVLRRSGTALDAVEQAIISLENCPLFNAGRGAVFTHDGVHELELSWYNASQHGNYLEDRAYETMQVPTTFQGRRAVMFVRPGSSDLTTLVEPTGTIFLEVRGDLGSEQAYRDVVASFKPVSVEDWLGALPASVVNPDDRSAVVQSMLSGIPLPVGFDANDIATRGSVSDRYQLGAQVVDAVACRWFDQWFTATEKADEPSAKAASDALNSSPSWPVLKEMASEGALSEVLAQYVEGLSTEAVLTGSGPVRATRENVDKGLGCSWSQGSAATIPS